MNTMTYKGFIGSVSFSEQDEVFYGKIEGISSLVNFEGESVSELKSSFHQAVDDYVEFCKEQNIPAKRSYSGQLNVRISPETHTRIAILSHLQGISINAFIKHALDQAVAGM